MYEPIAAMRVFTTLQAGLVVAAAGSSWTIQVYTTLALTNSLQGPVKHLDMCLPTYWGLPAKGCNCMIRLPPF